MPTHNPENERMKRRYFAYLKEARRYSEASVDASAKALNRFECFTKYRAFKLFHVEQAIAFKRALGLQASVRTGERLSKATLYSTLNALRNFFLWLADQPGYRSRIGYSEAEYFNLSEKETRVAKARRETPVPSIEQIRHVLSVMEDGSDVERRNKALVAFTLLTGARDSAVASLKLKHLNLEQGKVVQDAREVRTKFSKTFTTWFFPVGLDVREILERWVTYLREEHLWGPDDPLFPATKMAVGSNMQFAPVGLDRKHWSSAAPIRSIFKSAFHQAGLPYFNPHSFRNTLVTHGEKLCRTPEQFKAWSQNLGHEKVMTTFANYGNVAPARQAEIIMTLADSSERDPRFDDLFAKLVQVAREMT